MDRAIRVIYTRAVHIRELEKKTKTKASETKSGVCPNPSIMTYGRFLSSDNLIARDMPSYSHRAISWPMIWRSRRNLISKSLDCHRFVASRVAQDQCQLSLPHIKDLSAACAQWHATHPHMRHYVELADKVRTLGLIFARKFNTQKVI